RATHPGIRFDVGTIDDLEQAAGGLGGILSWFSTIHHAPDAVSRPLREFARTVRPDGGLLLGFFVGRVLEPFDHAVTRAWRWPLDDLSERVDAAGFDIVETHTRATRGARPVGTLIGERRA
uniref:class I SAM-dependent methyltransferase n=1 Tax=uncultured Microbacterium sp. TaxID=191216 RepID=UPI0025E8B08F